MGFSFQTIEPTAVSIYESSLHQTTIIHLLVLLNVKLPFRLPPNFNNYDDELSNQSAILLKIEQLCDSTGKSIIKEAKRVP